MSDKIKFLSHYNKARLTLQCLFEGRVVKLPWTEDTNLFVLGEDFDIYSCNKDGEIFPQMGGMEFRTFLTLCKEIEEADMVQMAASLALTSINKGKRK